MRTTTIEELKKFSTEEEEKKFHSIWRQTKNAIKAASSNTSTLTLFSEEKKTAYSPVENCDIDFRQIGVLISQASDGYTKDDAINDTIEQIPAAISHLKSQLEKFYTNDNDETRKKIYQNAIDYLDNLSKQFFSSSSSHKPG